MTVSFVLTYYFCVLCIVFLFLFTAVNTGIILWFQQFWAVFMKRFYNFIRFWANVVWQLIIPLIFVILSLVFAVTVGQGDVTTEPSRVISVPRSALSSNRTFFWAQFGSAGDNVSFEARQSCEMKQLLKFSFRV